MKRTDLELYLVSQEQSFIVREGRTEDHHAQQNGESKKSRPLFIIFVCLVIPPNVKKSEGPRFSGAGILISPVKTSPISLKIM